MTLVITTPGTAIMAFTRGSTRSRRLRGMGADVAVMSHASSSILFVYPACTTGQAVTVKGCSVAIVGDQLLRIAALAGNG